MKPIFIVISIFFSCLISAQTKEVLFLWPNEVPGETEPKHEPVQTDNTSGDVIRLTNITNPSLTVFKPEKPNNSKAAVIVSPGGGYSILAVNKEGYEIAEWLNTLGYTAFVLQYRVPKKRKGALQDIQRAIRTVRSKASVYNLNPQKIGVLGFSAGGHLSALASTSYKKDAYPKIDAIDELSSRPNFSMLVYPAYLDKGENKSISPELEINQNTPPFFIFGTMDDRYGNSPLVMATALRNKKVPVALHMLSEGGHGYGLRKGNIAAKTWLDLAEIWLNKMVKSRALAKYERTINFPQVIEFPKRIPKKKDVWVFMMAGQSNMAGRGFVEPQDTIPSERILTINKENDIILAKEPLHFYEPKMGGLDSGLSFAKSLLKDIPKNVSILLIPTAVGGSSINKWVNDSVHRDVKLLSNFKEKVVLAKKYGTVKGILWHQGESDANKKKIPKYNKNLAILFKTFRKSVGNKTLPILMGELGSYSKKKESWIAINNAINKYASKDRYISVVKTSDLKDKGDKLHFNSEGQRMMGKRFAEAYIELIKPKNK
ncbi:sialate O-acetylesterase [Flavivirga aquimarina]|uniref:Sialate O-acetylesterase n=1 Tax=Flavivirga aquimarina TaxID=2027862 RepID=A0ABT8WC57_9FLAO|nr:sialate O-acetylesterase [Flavivirga aquimarina]MDO5970735.1 sialate O-acetylesterase [Flavivirga aquimarina]